MTPPPAPESQARGPQAAAPAAPATGNGSGPEGEVLSGPGYPPETHKLLSWASIQFINRPSWKPLAWVCFALVAILLCGGIGGLFLKLDVRVAGNGEIGADPGVLKVVSKAGGTLSSLKVAPGTTVTAGDVLAVLGSGMGEGRLEGVLQGLQRNVELLSLVDRRSGMRRDIESGRALAELADDDVRKAATVLQLSLDRLRGSLASETPFLALRDEALQASSLLRSTRIGYLERQRVRAPSAGNLLQYEAPTNSAVKPGDVVAILLPQDARLIARITLEPREVVSVEVGQLVRHQVEAYPFQRYGLFEGKVLAIEQAPPQPDGSLRYVVRATIANPPNLSQKLEKTIRLIMGMKVQSEIVTGRKPLSEIVIENFVGGR